MARIPDIERRLLNWARWRALMSDGGGNFATSQMDQERVDRSGWDAPTVIPTSDAEAEETEKAVHALERSLHLAVTVFYLGSKGHEAKARRLGIAVTTMYARIQQAHASLDRWLREARAAADLERQRVEALQRTLAPADKAPSIFKSAPAAPSPKPPGQAPRSPLADWLAERRAQRAG